MAQILKNIKEQKKAEVQRCACPQSQRFYPSTDRGTLHGDVTWFAKDSEVTFS